MVPSAFPIIAVDAFEPQDEAMGTKRKHWFVRDELRGSRRYLSRWLFKYSQEGTGQDWAEKIACELADRLDLPHAQVELASYHGYRGCMVKSVLTSHARDVLVHGNELLWEFDPTYEKDQRSPSTHTVGRVLATLDDCNIGPPRSPRTNQPHHGLLRGSDWFVGYLMLDALIGNTDRHHENWAIVQPKSEVGSSSERTLAPSFDHGSSLSRELRDEERAWRLREGWATAGVAYANRARSGLFEASSDKRPVHPRAAFLLAATKRPEAAKLFLQRLQSVEEIFIDEVIERIPQERMSADSKRFVALLIRDNRVRILEAAQ